MIKKLLGFIPIKHEDNPEDYVQFELNEFIIKEMKRLERVYERKFGYDEVVKIIEKNIKYLK